MSTAAINSYDGAGYVPGVGRPPRRDGIKKTHRELVKRFVELGVQALNAADYERTMHLPIGGGRLACDRETGDFDADSPRLSTISNAPYPRHVHSTITDGEFLRVHNRAEHDAALNTRKWADTPLERKKRFTLTPEDQMQNLKGQIEAERARGLELERRIEANVSTPAPADMTAILGAELQREREARVALEARIEAMLSRFDMTTPVNEVAAVVEDEDETEYQPVAAKSRRK